MLKIRFVACFDYEQAICKSIRELVKLVKVNSSFNFKSDRLIFHKGDDSIEVAVQINCSIVDSSNEIVFTIGIDLEDGFDQFRTLSIMREEFDKMLKRVHPESCQLILTRDDVASSFGKKAYPLIQEVENGMRDVISRFLLTKVGSSYFRTYNHKDIVNKKVKESISNRVYDPVYNLDFIDIISLLTKKFATINEHGVERTLKCKIKSSDEKIKILEDYVKKSNYERFFSEIIGENEKKIVDAWKELYSYRNSVAHNRGLTRSQYRNVTIFHNYFLEIIDKLESAVDKMELTENDIFLISKHGFITPADYILSQEYIKSLNLMTQRQRNQLVEKSEELHMIFGGSSTISEMIDERLKNIDWDLENKVVIYPSDFDGDFEYKSLDDLVHSINESVILSVQENLPISIIKESAGLDYTQDVIEKMIKKYKVQLEGMGWTEYI